MQRTQMDGDLKIDTVRSCAEMLVSSIPRIFHSVWLSREPVPALLGVGESSFSNLHPEFEIKRWSQDDVVSETSTFLCEALRHKKWAFATDYIRLKALYEFGGVYADGDVVFRNRLDEFMSYNCVLTWESYFALGPHFMMARPRHPLIKRFLDLYNSRRMVHDEFLDCTPMPVLLTWLLVTESSLVLNGERQLLPHNTLVEEENVFTSNYRDGKNICEHLYYGGWLPNNISYRHQLNCIYARHNRPFRKHLHHRILKALPENPQWMYHYFRNAGRSFPVLHERHLPKWFRVVQRLPLLSLPLSRTTVLSVTKNVNPLVAVSRWHKARLEVATIYDSGKVHPSEFYGSETKAPAVIKRADHLVSVVVPIYNTEKYLVRCLQSIRSQSYKHLDVILVDDGSTDGSSAIAQEACGVDDRFRYFTKENGGLGDARNFSIPYLRGDLVVFVDSDDFLSSQYVEAMEGKFKEGHDLAICDFALCLSDGRIQQHRELSRFWGETDPILHALVSEAECYAWNKMYSVDVFRNDRLARYGRGWFEDFALTPALIASSRNIAFVPGCLYNYVQRRDSILSQSRNSAEKNIEIFSAYKLLQNHRNKFTDLHWKEYHDWCVPKHLFYWRISAIHKDPIHSRRVSIANEFARSLNEALPDWHRLPYVNKFIEGDGRRLGKIQRRALVDCYRKGDVTAYSVMKDIWEYGF
jgi:glycosyltransferase involved in cell wall biosynthesis